LKEFLPIFENNQMDKTEEDEEVIKQRDYHGVKSGSQAELGINQDDAGDKKTVIKRITLNF
jgi:hypothetical protein